MTKKRAAASVDLATLGEMVQYTLSEKEAARQRANIGLAQTTLAAVVTAIDEDGSARLSVFLPTGEMLPVSGAVEGEGPHTWRPRV